MDSHTQRRSVTAHLDRILERFAVGHQGSTRQNAVEVSIQDALVDLVSESKTIRVNKCCANPTDDGQGDSLACAISNGA